jgi:hypothetical protein
MKRFSRLAVVTGLLVAAACADQTGSPTEANPPVQAAVGELATPGNHVHVMPTRAQYAAAFAKAGAAPSSGTGIYYHGGPVMAQPKVVAIYWSSSPIYKNGPATGSGPASQDNSLIGTFLSTLGGSNYWKINQTYYNGAGVHVGAVGYDGYWATGTNPSAKPSDADMQNLIISGNGSAYTLNSETIYLVFTGPGINLGGGFGTQYCAYHGHFNYNGVDVKYAAQPYNLDYPSGCTANRTSPNNDPAADAEINTLAHEIEEAASDPDLNAWFDRRGYENADKCAWNFGTTASSNMTIGANRYLIQQNWINSGSGGCRLSG